MPGEKMLQKHYSDTHIKCFICNKHCRQSRATLLSIFKSQNKLQDIAPAYGWRGLGNVLGDYGEYMAIRHYGLEKAPKGTKGFDAVSKEGRKVQIKTCLHSSTVSYRGDVQDLLVLQADNEGRLREIYAGPFDNIQKEFLKGGKMKPQESVTDRKFFLKVSDLINLNVHEFTRKDCKHDEIFLPSVLPESPKHAEGPNRNQFALEKIVVRNEEELNEEERTIQEGP
jgi:hypothetical protein